MWGVFAENRNRHLLLYIVCNQGGTVHERISIDPKVCHGQACVRGTRIPVHQIVHMLANGDSTEDLLKEYPSLTKKDIAACLEYAAVLAEEEVSPIEASGS